MGRYYSYRRATVEESCDLSIFQLKQLGMLSSQATEGISWKNSRTGERTSLLLTVDVTGEPYARFMHVADDAEGYRIDYDYRVRLLTTACHFGGIRYWFACPECGNRVGGLYLAPGRRSFMCRYCADLTYQSRNRSGIALWGHRSRQIETLRSQIKRWTWRGRPTRKARRLLALERQAAQPPRSLKRWLR